MATIYTKNGQQVYDYNGQTYSATTGELIGAPLKTGDIVPSTISPIATATTTVPPATPITITSDLFTPIQTQDFVKPTDIFIYPVAGLNAEGQATPLPQEQEQSDVIKRTQSLYDQLTGKTAYQAEQETLQGIPALKQTQQDLSARLKALQNEALAIPLQLQEEAKGRGITTGGLAPIEAGRLRANAIQALGVSSLLEASKGNLTLAQDLADRAVAQKYDPIEARISANLKNLELLSKDPTLTVAQQNRLDAQKTIQEKKKADAAEAKANETATRAEALKYAGIADSVTLDEMSKAKSALEVAQIAQKKGLKTLEQKQKELNLRKTQADIQKIITGDMGSGGLIDAILENPALYDTLTPSIKSKILPQLTRAGFQYQGKPLSAEAQKTKENANSGLRAIQTLEDEIKKGGRKKLFQAAVPFGLGGARILRTARNEIADVITRLRTGAALNEQEQAFYKSQMPSALDGGATIKYKLDLFRQLFQRLSGPNVQTSVSTPIIATQKDNDYIKSLNLK